MRFLICILLALVALCSSACAQAIWYFPLPDQPTPGGFLVDPDYQQLFENGAAWSRTMARVRVFGLGPHFAQAGPEPELRRIFAFLKEHSIGLSVEWPVVTAVDCGDHTEGINHHYNESANVARRIRALGGRWTYVAADAPLQAGHYRTMSPRGERNGCRFPISELAANVARNIGDIRDVFPDITVIDQEPLTPIRSEDDIRSWIGALRRELGSKAPVAMHFDVQWNKRWDYNAEFVIPTLQQLGLGYGVIFNGDFVNRTDAAWTGAARSHIRAWEAAVRVPPRAVVFEGWTDHPTHVLPENDPTTIMSLIGWYCTHSIYRVGCSGR